MKARVYNGIISGEKAHNYPSHMYRTARIHPLTLRDLDPDRVYYDREYPRWSSGVSDGGGDIEEHVDYVVMIDDDAATFVTTVTLILCATANTSAKEDVVACRFTLNELGYIGDQLLVDQALRYAFD